MIAAKFKSHTCNIWYSDQVEELFNKLFVNGHDFGLDDVPRVQEGVASSYFLSSWLCLLWVLLLSQEFSVGLFGRQGRTHLDMIKLEVKRNKSRQSGWQTWGISSISSVILSFLSFHVISPFLSLPSMHLCFLPSYLRFSCPLSFISSFWLWSLSFYLLFFNSRLPLTIPSFLYPRLPLLLHLPTLQPHFLGEDYYVQQTACDYMFIYSNLSLCADLHPTS